MYMLQLQLKNIVYIYIHTPTDLMVKHNPSLHKTLWPCQSSWLYMYMPPRKLSKSSFSNLPFHLFAPCSTRYPMINKKKYLDISTCNHHINKLMHIIISIYQCILSYNHMTAFALTKCLSWYNYISTYTSHVCHSF